MKSKLFLFASILMVFNSLAQCPTTPILIESQEEIDNFVANYPNCSVLTNELRVIGDISPITNLNGLSSITNAQSIFIHRTDILDFSGLHNLETVENLSIWFNSSIQNFNGLSALQSATIFDIARNPELLNASGLNNLQEVERISIFENFNLSDLSQFSFVTSLTSLVIGGNALTTLSGLENLQTIHEDLLLSFEPLSNVDELSSLTNIGGSLYVFSQPNIQNLSAFNSLTTLKDLTIVDCPNLDDLSGLEELEIVVGTLRIGFLNQLEDLSFLSNLLYAGNLEIYENTNLQSLTGLENLIQIDQSLKILTNPLLSNIEALNNVSTSEIVEVVVAYNSNLSVCTTDFMCTVVNNASITKFINDNSVGCSSVEEIQKECLLGSKDFTISNAVYLYPNPVSEMLQVYFPNELKLQSVSIYSLLGEKLSETHQKIVDFSNFASGVYLVEIGTNRGTISKKVVKN